LYDGEPAPEATLTENHETMPTNRLFALIVRVVAENRHAPLTVREIGAELRVAPGVIASCIALHSSPSGGVIDPEQVSVLADHMVVDTVSLGLVAPM
jgi:hypothetical protein